MKVFNKISIIKLIKIMFAIMSQMYWFIEICVANNLFFINSTLNAKRKKVAVLHRFSHP